MVPFERLGSVLGRYSWFQTTRFGFTQSDCGLIEFTYPVRKNFAGLSEVPPVGETALCLEAALSGFVTSLLLPFRFTDFLVSSASVSKVTDFNLQVLRLVSSRVTLVPSRFCTSGTLGFLGMLTGATTVLVSLVDLLNITTAFSSWLFRILCSRNDLGSSSNSNRSVSLLISSLEVLGLNPLRAFPGAFLCRFILFRF